MKQRIMERMFDLIAQRAQTADSQERAALTAEIERLREKLNSL